MSNGKQSVPTMKLRWIEAEENDIKKMPLVKVYEYVTYFYKLQQYWQNNDGTGEWRDIEVEYE